MEQEIKSEIFSGANGFCFDACKSSFVDDRCDYPVSFVAAGGGSVSHSDGDEKILLVPGESPLSFGNVSVLAANQALLNVSTNSDGDATDQQTLRIISADR